MVAGPHPPEGGVNRKGKEASPPGWKQRSGRCSPLLRTAPPPARALETERGWRGDATPQGPAQTVTQSPKSRHPGLLPASRSAGSAPQECAPQESAPHTCPASACGWARGHRSGPGSPLPPFLLSQDPGHLCCSRHGAREGHWPLGGALYAPLALGQATDGVRAVTQVARVGGTWDGEGTG